MSRVLHCFENASFLRTGEVFVAGRKPSDGCDDHADANCSTCIVHVVCGDGVYGRKIERYDREDEIEDAGHIEKQTEFTQRICTVDVLLVSEATQNSHEQRHNVREV